MLRLLRRICVAAAFLITIGVVSPARAVTGYVTGSWQFWNQNGNYCPSNNDCVGAWYTQSMYDTPLPISNGSVWIIDTSDAIIGTGSTDDNGNYTVAWSRSTFPSQIGVVILPYHKDGRFFLADASGLLINDWFGFFNTAASTSPSAPQDVGSHTVGSSNDPSWYDNAYWAIEWQWRFTMSVVGILQTNLTYVEIRGFADVISGYLPYSMDTCETSCAWGPTKKVHLDDNAGLAPQARAMHEVGHIASYVTHPWQLANGSGTIFGVNMSYGGSGWSPYGPEWGSGAFEEAWATHYGSATFWADDAETPTTCLSTNHCYDPYTGEPAEATDLEATSYPYSTNNCGSAESRWPLSAMRYFWDVFDNHNDCIGDTYSAAQGQWADHFYNLAWYPEGTGVDQIDETWNSARTSVTEPDGRGSSSYMWNYYANAADTYFLWEDNCSPP